MGNFLTPASSKRFGHLIFELLINLPVRADWPHVILATLFLLDIGWLTIGFGILARWYGRILSRRLLPEIWGLWGEVHAGNFVSFDVLVSNQRLIAGSIARSLLHFS
jgi:hypothetical protein